MEQFEYEIMGNNRFLIYTLSPSDILDSVTLGMMENNTVYGLLPLRFLQKDEQRIVKYDISEMHSWESFLNDAKDGMQTLLMLKSVSDSLIDAEEYMIGERSFILETDWMFIGNDGKIQSICLPIENRTGNTFQEFCCSLVYRLKNACCLEEKFFYGIQSYLDGNKFSPKEFSRFLEQIELESAVPYFHQAPNRKNNIRLGKEERVFSERENITKESGPVILTRNGVKEENVHAAKVENCEKEEGTMLLGEEETSFLYSGNIRGYLIRQATQERIYIDKNEFCIGKSYQNTDYRVSDNPTISRHHARIVRRGDVFFIVDTNSKNHTYVDRRRIESNREIMLTNGSTIRLSDEDFLFSMEGVERQV